MEEIECVFGEDESIFPVLSEEMELMQKEFNALCQRRMDREARYNKYLMSEYMRLLKRPFTNWYETIDEKWFSVTLTTVRFLDHIGYDYSEYGQDFDMIYDTIEIIRRRLYEAELANQLQVE